MESNGTPDVALDLEVLNASQIMGEIVARAICAECPGLDQRALSDVCAAEVFMAAQDMKRCAWVESAQQAARLRSERPAA